jgi:hypothetical protein
MDMIEIAVAVVMPLIAGGAIVIGIVVVADMMVAEIGMLVAVGVIAVNVVVIGVIVAGVTVIVPDEIAALADQNGASGIRASARRTHNPLPAAPAR